MGFYLIVCTYLSLSGVAYIAMMIWTRVNKERLLSTYRPGTIAHEATLKNLRLHRLPITFCLTVFSALGSALLIQELFENHSDVAGAVIRVSFVVSLFLLFLTFYAVYRTYKIGIKK